MNEEVVSAGGRYPNAVVAKELIREGKIGVRTVSIGVRIRDGDSNFVLLDFLSYKSDYFTR